MQYPIVFVKKYKKVFKFLLDFFNFYFWFFNYNPSLKVSAKCYWLKINFCIALRTVFDATVGEINFLLS